MSPEELDSLADRILARQRQTDPRRTAPAVQPKQHNAIGWIAGVAGALAVAAMGAAFTTWRSVAVIEAEVAIAKQDVLAIGTKLDTIGTKLDQLIGAHQRRPDEPPAPRR